MRPGLFPVVSALAAAFAITPAARAADPYNVDIVLSLTGPGALLGQTEQRALQQFENRLRQGQADRRPRAALRLP